MNKAWALKQKGFTIVELLIVIVVIGILAAITIVAYNGVQNRANNAKIVSAAAELEKAVQLWHVDTGGQPYSGASSTGVIVSDPNSSSACPGATSAGGWVGSGAGYQCGLEDLLVAHKLIPSTLIPSLPPNKTSGNTPQRTFMFYGCSGVTGGYILMWYLLSPSSADATRFDSAWQTCTGNPTVLSNSTIYYTSYGMRSGEFIQL